MAHPVIDADVAGFFGTEHGFAIEALRFLTPTDPNPVTVRIIVTDEVEEFAEGLSSQDGTRRTCRSDQKNGIDYGQILEFDNQQWEVVNVDALTDGAPTFLLKYVG